MDTHGRSHCGQQHLSRHGVQTSTQMCLTFLYRFHRSRLHCTCSLHTQYTCVITWRVSQTHCISLTFTYTADLMMSMKQGTNMAAVPIPWTMRPSTHIHRVLQKYTIWFITLIACFLVCYVIYLWLISWWFQFLSSVLCTGPDFNLIVANRSTCRGTHVGRGSPGSGPTRM
jgi:hypothetical protein